MKKSKKLGYILVKGYPFIWILVLLYERIRIMKKFVDEVLFIFGFIFVVFCCIIYSSCSILYTLVKKGVVLCTD